MPFEIHMALYLNSLSVLGRTDGRILNHKQFTKALKCIGLYLNNLSVLGRTDGRILFHTQFTYAPSEKFNFIDDHSNIRHPTELR